MVRGAATLPHGTGRTTRVCVFAKDDAAQQARDAGGLPMGGVQVEGGLTVGLTAGELCRGALLPPAMPMPRGFVASLYLPSSAFFPHHCMFLPSSAFFPQVLMWWAMKT